MCRNTMVKTGDTPSPSPTKPCPWGPGHRFDSFLEEGRLWHEFTMRARVAVCRRMGSS